MSRNSLLGEVERDRFKLHEGKTIRYFLTYIVSLLSILENFSLVLDFSVNMKSIIVLS